MDILGLVFAGFVVLSGSVTTGVCFGIRPRQPFLGVLGLVASILYLFQFASSSHSVLNDGSPVTEIAPGTYKAGFVYKAGSNVNVGIERFEKIPRYAAEGTEHLFLCQFPAKDFEGEIKAGAKKLTAYKLVTGSGIFNKYKLE